MKHAMATMSSLLQTRRKAMNPQALVVVASALRGMTLLHPQIVRGTRWIGLPSAKDVYQEDRLVSAEAIPGYSTVLQLIEKSVASR